MTWTWRFNCAAGFRINCCSVYSANSWPGGQMRRPFSARSEAPSALSSALKLEFCPKNKKEGGDQVVSFHSPSRWRKDSRQDGTRLSNPWSSTWNSHHLAPKTPQPEQITSQHCSRAASSIETWPRSTLLPCTRMERLACYSNQVLDSTATQSSRGEKNYPNHDLRHGVGVPTRVSLLCREKEEREDEG